MVHEYYFMRISLRSIWSGTLSRDYYTYTTDVIIVVYYLSSRLCLLRYKIKKKIQLKNKKKNRRLPLRRRNWFLPVKTRTGPGRGLRLTILVGTNPKYIDENCTIDFQK